MTNTKYVAVRFQTSTFGEVKFDSFLYDYKVLDDSIDVGDLVVVETRYGYKVAEVAEVLSSSKHAKSYVVQKIDLIDFNAAKVRAKRQAEIEAELKRRLEKENELEEYRRLVKLDKSTAALVEELLQLRGDK